MLKKFFTRRKLNIIFSASALILMWLVWIIAYYGVGNNLIVPSFTQTAAAFFGNFGKASFWLATLNTLFRTLVAFIISFVIAAVCAAVGALSKSFKAFLKPVMVFIRTLPTMAVILLILKATYGNRTLSPVIVTVLVLMPMIYSQLAGSVEGIDGGLIEMAKIYCLSKRDRLFKIYIPHVLPDALFQTGANISLGLKVMVSAEILASTAKGLGGMMQQSNIAAETANLAALTLTAVILGLIIDFAFSQLERITFKWNKGEGARDD